MDQQSKIDIFYKNLTKTTYWKTYVNYKEEYLKLLIEKTLVNCDELTTKNFFKTCPKPKNSCSKNAVEFWIFRGWTNLEAKIKVKEFVKTKPRLNSPFSYKFYVERGFSEEAAKMEAKSKSPTNAEYWIRKFNFDEKTAVIKATEQKSKNNKLGAIGSASRPADAFRYSSVMCIEYWLIQGYDIGEATEKLDLSRARNKETNFSLKNCIEKYGEVNGTTIWQTRQDSWQNTLKTKSAEEIALMNSFKAVNLRTYINKFGETGYKEYVKYLDQRKYKYFSNEEDLCSYLKYKFSFYGYEENSIIRINQFLFGALNIVNPLEYCKLKFSDVWGIKPAVPFITRGTYGNMYREFDSYNEPILLRSSLEYYTLILLKEKNINFLSNKQYPNSRMMYDFYLVDINVYVEIAGMSGDDYDVKIKYKAATWGSVILKTTKQIKDYVDSL